jgi:exosortase
MNGRDAIAAAALVTSGAVLWWRAVQQGDMSLADAAPLLIAFPLAWHLGQPWSLDRQRPCSWITIGAAVADIALGESLNFPFLSGLGWVLAVAGSGILHSLSSIPPKRLLLLPLLGFPWLVGAGGLGWYFRLSAAWIAELSFSAAGFALTREGTQLSIQGEPLSVEAACAGLGSLQAMLLAGTAAALLELGRSRRFWLAIPILAAAAWLGNTLRVLLLSAVTLSSGHSFATGWFHNVSGWAVLAAIFGACLALFRSWASPTQRTTTITTTSPAPPP